MDATFFPNLCLIIFAPISVAVPVSKLSPKKWGVSGSSSLLLIALLAGVSVLLNQGIDIRPNLAAILGLSMVDAIFLGGSCLAQISSYWPPHRRRILVHEAGHLLVGKPCYLNICDAIEIVQAIWVKMIWYQQVLWGINVSILWVSLHNSDNAFCWFVLTNMFYTSQLSPKDEVFGRMLWIYFGNSNNVVALWFCSVSNGLSNSWCNFRPNYCYADGHSGAGIFILASSLVILPCITISSKIIWLISQ